MTRLSDDIVLIKTKNHTLYIQLPTKGTDSPLTTHQEVILEQKDEIEKLQGEIDKLTSLLAEDGGEVKYKSLAEHIVDAIWVELSDRSITNGIDTATEQEVVDSLIQIAEKELNFYNGASQHTKGEGV